MRRKQASLNSKQPKILKSWLQELEQIKQAYVSVDDVRKVNVTDTYNIHLAGHVQIVKSPSFFKSLVYDFRAARKGDGFYFPNWNAWREGQLSTYNFFSQLPPFSLFMSARDEVIDIKRMVASSHSVLFNKNKNHDDEIDDEPPMSNLYSNHAILGSKSNPKNLIDVIDDDSSIDEISSDSDEELEPINPGQEEQQQSLRSRFTQGK